MDEALTGDGTAVAIDRYQGFSEGFSELVCEFVRVEGACFKAMVDGKELLAKQYAGKEPDWTSPAMKPYYFSWSRRLART